MPPHGEEQGFQGMLLEVVEPKTIKPQFTGKWVDQISDINIPPSTKQPKQIQSHRTTKEEMIMRFHCIPTIRAQYKRNVQAYVRKINPCREFIKKHTPSKNIKLYREQFEPSRRGERALIAKYFKNIYKPTNNNLRTSSNTRNKTMDNSSRSRNDRQSGQFENQRRVTVAGARETVEYRKPKRAKDYACHKEKMLLSLGDEDGFLQTLVGALGMERCLNNQNSLNIYTIRDNYGVVAKRWPNQSHLHLSQLDLEQAQRDKDMQKNLALVAKYFKNLYKPNNLRTSSNSKNKNVDTTPRYKNDNQIGQFRNQRTVTVAGARETVGSQKPKRVKDYTYHKEKMLMCKQAEKGVPLQVEQADWLEDTDEEIDEQELEAYYSFMAKIKEVPTVDSGTHTEPLEQTELEKYMAFNDCTINYDKLEHKLNKTIGLLAQKEIYIKEGLELKAYEILVVKEKHEELVKQSLLTKSHYEGLVKERTKVITDLKSKPTFANPMYLKKAQSKKPCLYEIPYDTSNPATRFIHDREETLTLEKESRSKLSKDLVKPYDYTKHNSLYENFKPASKEYHDQLAHANEVRKKMWKKSFVKTKPIFFKNIIFLPNSKSISKSRQAYNVMTDNINYFRELVDQAWEKHSHDHFRAPAAHDMEILIKTCLMPLALNTQNDSFTFVHELKQEIHTNLKYVESLENEIDKLEFDKAEFSNMYDLLLQECMYQIDSRTTQSKAPQLPQTSKNTNPRVSTSSRVIHKTNSSRPQLRSTQMKDKVMPNNSQVKDKKTEVEDHHMISKLKTQRSCERICCNTLNKTVASESTIQKSKSYYRMLYEKTSKAWKWWIEQQCHQDINSPMRVSSINGKKYILVIVDDYSRYTWTLFLRSKDETPEVLKDFLTMIQRNLQALVISVRIDRGTEFLNKTLYAFFKEEGIEHQTSTPRTPKQNGIVERQNRTSTVNKSSSPTNNSKQQDTPPTTNNPSSTEPTTLTINVHAEENNDNQAKDTQVQRDEFINPFCTPVREVVESPSRNINNSNMHTFINHKIPNTDGQKITRYLKFVEIYPSQ
nr:retrovirus-related Pol polyprotein from transposon TNT 1-94 [Tanacetum cinerariifolium]